MRQSSSPALFFDLDKFMTILGWRLVNPSHLKILRTSQEHAFKDAVLEESVHSHPLQIGSEYALLTPNISKNAKHVEPYGSVSLHYGKNWLHKDPMKHLIPYQELHLHFLRPLDLKNNRHLLPSILHLHVWQDEHEHYTLTRLDYHDGSSAQKNEEYSELASMIPSAWLLTHQIEERIRYASLSQTPHDVLTTLPHKM